MSTYNIYDLFFKRSFQLSVSDLSVIKEKQKQKIKKQKQKQKKKKPSPRVSVGAILLNQSVWDVFCLLMH